MKKLEFYTDVGYLIKENTVNILYYFYLLKKFETSIFSQNDQEETTQDSERK